jgi:hypothetical protein
MRNTTKIKFNGLPDLTVIVGIANITTAALICHGGAVGVRGAALAAVLVSVWTNIKARVV